MYLIGSTTCGKPYGFYPTDNCGTTYFTHPVPRRERRELRRLHRRLLAGQHARRTSARRLPGCSVADDFTHALGDPPKDASPPRWRFRASNNQTLPAASGLSIRG